MRRISWIMPLVLIACSSERVDLGETGGAGGNGGSAGNGASAGIGGIAGTGGSTNTGGTGNEPNQKSSDLDLLFVIDNSISQSDKQQVLSDGIPELMARLVNPRCVDSSGNAVAQPASPDVPCPSGSQRENPPVKSLHVGAISSSLGAHGGDTCAETSPNFKPDQNDRAHLIPSVRGVATYQDQGFFTWGAGISGSATSVDELAKQTRDMILAVGETGCGYEAPLEAMYRFLVDPNPPQTIERQGAISAAVGTDSVLLAQRAKFLRPGSTVAVVLLTDENDCSILDEGQGWVMSTGSPGLPRATSACKTNPDDACCTSCATADVAGCTPHGSDAECAKGNFSGPEDHVNLRCWQQKRRFGVDFLYPVERYVHGLSDAKIEDREGKTVDNPLFASVGGKTRLPGQVVLATITGVPWQLLAKPSTVSGATPLELMSPAELATSGAWSKILPQGQTPPGDAHMIEDYAPRPGLPGPSASYLEDPVHGHEWDIAGAFGAQQGPGELQYACNFALPATRDCAGATGGCDCNDAGVNGKNPLCQDSDGSYSSIQRRAKAYPGVRQLEVTRQLGERGVAASICPKTLEGSVRDSGFGYNPLIVPLFARLQTSLQ
ncbi:MAG: hypothetical protein R3B13_09105 [Polyangiaceae bacterium]